MFLPLAFTKVFLYCFHAMFPVFFTPLKFSPFSLSTFFFVFCHFYFSIYPIFLFLHIPFPLYVFTVSIFIIFFISLFFYLLNCCLAFRFYPFYFSIPVFLLLSFNFQLVPSFNQSFPFVPLILVKLDIFSYLCFSCFQIYIFLSLFALLLFLPNSSLSFHFFYFFRLCVFLEITNLLHSDTT